MAISLASAGVRAQQLEPRAYSPAPVGLNLLGVATGYSSGSVLSDPSLPIKNASASVFNVAPFYARTFGLAGRLASIGAAVPYAWATARGDVQEVSRRVERSGLFDPSARLTLNLIGGPALSPREFLARRPTTTLGTSFVLLAPLGQYDPSKLVNLGTNRWAVRAELGLSQPLGSWFIELSTGVWWFGSNPDFYGGQVRKQDALASYQAHIVYQFLGRWWVAGDLTYYEGGSTTLGGQAKNDRQNNTRAGLTLSVPVAANQSVKASWTRGVSTRIGTDFTTWGLAWDLRLF